MIGLVNIVIDGIMIGALYAIFAAGLVLIFASLAYKVRVEESWLNGHFGRAYSQYRRDVAALIPGLF